MAIKMEINERVTNMAYALYYYYSLESEAGRGSADGSWIDC